MQNMENVYEINPQTEQGSKVKQEEKIGSTDLGKFKDVNALLQAYQSLQAEFTRRSQRLKRYEEQENQRRNAVASIGANPQATVESDGAEKPEDLETEKESVTEANGESSAQSAAEAMPERAVADGLCEADALCAESEGPCSAVEEKIAANGEDGDSGVGGSCADADNVTVENEGKYQSERVVEQSAQKLYEQASANEEVRLRIVGDYLSSIGKSNAPFVRGGASALVTPPKKPRNLADAGNMALAYLKAYKEQV